MWTLMKNVVKAKAGRRSTWELATTRWVDAPIEQVWRAWTEPEQLREWLTGPSGWPMTTCEVDLRAGGAWRLGWSDGEGTEMRIHGLYREVAPPERLVSTSSWGEEWPGTLETLVLEAVEGGTRVVQSTRYESEDAYDAALGSGVKEGMVEAMANLERYLSAAVRSVDPGAV